MRFEKEKLWQSFFGTVYIYDMMFHLLLKEIRMKDHLQLKEIRMKDHLQLKFHKLTNSCRG
jgi:hypothetical protein